MTPFQELSWREKTTALYLASQVVCFGPYFVYLALLKGQSLPVLEQLLGYGITTLSQLTLLGLGHWWLRRRFAKEAYQTADERDLVIDQHATRRAYGILMTGMIITGCVMPFSDPPQAIFQAAVFFLVLSEASRNVMVLWAYHRERC